MPTATAPRKGTVVSFVSRGENLVLVRVGEQEDVLAGGQTRTVRPEILGGRATRLEYRFAPLGRLDVKVGQDMIADGPEDDDGNPTMQDAVQWLEGHENNGDLHGAQGERALFWAAGKPPGSITPTEAEMLDWIVDAVSRLDADRVRELSDAETETHKREVVLDAAQNALKRIQGERDRIGVQATPKVPSEPPDEAA